MVDYLNERRKAEMNSVKQNTEREYNAFTLDEQKAGENLYNVYWKYYRQYCATANPDWVTADPKTKIVFVRTAKDTKYNG